METVLVVAAVWLLSSFPVALLLGPWLGARSTLQGQVSPEAPLVPPRRVGSRGPSAVQVTPQFSLSHNARSAALN